MYKGVRGYARLALDLIWVGLSAFLAITIRENFQPSSEKLQGVVLYALLCVVSAAIVFSIARIHRTLWRYISLVDLLHLMAGVTVALLLALLGSFVIDRLEGVARSLPVIQWFLIVSLMMGARIAVRLLGERKSRGRKPSLDVPTAKEHVLIVGVSDLTELYLRSVAEFAQTLVVVGILTSEPEMRGRSLRKQKVLGAPKDIQRVLDQLEVHGVFVSRIVVTEPFEMLSKETQDALRDVERGSAIRVDWLIENLGLRSSLPEGQDDAQAALKNVKTEPTAVTSKSEYLSLGRYHTLKRVIDVVGVILSAVVLAPILALTALFVALDVGFPLVFWQQRPGRYGRPFKLFKFRTMRGAHDIEGNRIADELRSSSIGRFLRRSWLDETPQLYNILVGEMSFVGPRPLLPLDQPEGQASRLLVRPGLTGWAQVNGGRDIPSQDKAALDIFYIENASIWLDIKIILRTLGILVSGGQLNAFPPPEQLIGIETQNNSSE
jgi:lipopolysaccharide/colanic/teichoic acid biosynthesis glycosyltransferase